LLISSSICFFACVAADNTLAVDFLLTLSSMARFQEFFSQFSKCPIFICPSLSKTFLIVAIDPRGIVFQLDRGIGV
jgi:hypothetical protein